MNESFRIGISLHPLNIIQISLDRIIQLYKEKACNHRVNHIENNIVTFTFKNFEFKIEQNGIFTFFKNYKSINATNLKELYESSLIFLRNLLLENNIELNYKNEIDFIFSGRNVKKILNSDSFRSYNIEIDKLPLYNKEIREFDENFLVMTLKSSDYLEFPIEK